MNDNERSEHFKGFAKLLWDELFGREGMYDVWLPETSITDIHTHIAERAYDLVCYVLMHSNDSDPLNQEPTQAMLDAQKTIPENLNELIRARFPVEPYSEQDMLRDWIQRDIPDLTEWPQSDSQAPSPAPPSA